MLKLGFNRSFVDLILNGNSIACFSVVISGEAKGSISLGRGLREENPLSPYLLLVVAEGLSFMLHKANRDEMISELSIKKGNLVVSPSTLC